MKEKALYTRITILIVVGGLIFLGFNIKKYIREFQKTDTESGEEYFISDEINIDEDGIALGEDGDGASSEEGGNNEGGSNEAGGSSEAGGTGDGTATSDDGSSDSVSIDKAGQHKDIAEKILALINAERGAKEIPALAWDDATYSYCCTRAVQIVTAFNNNQKKSYYGENISKTDASFESVDDAAKAIHAIWSKSESDQNNYLDGSYISCSIAVYYQDDCWYAVETFSAAYSADLARQELLDSSAESYAAVYGYCEHGTCSKPAFSGDAGWACSSCYGLLSYDYNEKYNGRKFSCGCSAAESGMTQTDTEGKAFACGNCGKNIEVHEVEFDGETIIDAVYYFD